jgi:UDP-glucose 4-epimerase
MTLQMETPLGSFYHRRKVMVTGGLGFIGSNLAGRLACLGAQVVVVDALLDNCGGNRTNLGEWGERIQVSTANLNERAVLAERVEGCEVIFNLAGRGSHMDSMTDPFADLDDNVRAQVALLEACRQRAPQARIVFASTRQIYGRPQSLPVDESHPLHPVDVNGINKVAAEGYHTLYHEVHGLWTASLRLTNTYGPRMRVRDARQTFLGVWLRQVVEDKVFEVWGGEQQRDLCYVDDVVDALLGVAATAQAEGQIFNVGGCPPVSLLELARSLITIAGSGRFERREFPAAHKRIDIGDYFADDRRFRQLTDWRPRVSLEEGLARTVEYYRHHLHDYL